MQGVWGGAREKQKERAEDLRLKGRWTGVGGSVTWGWNWGKGWGGGVGGQGRQN